jgi:hypothetical protein
MDEKQWSQSSVFDAPEAITSAVRRAEDGVGAAPVPEAPPQRVQAGDWLLRTVERNPLTALLIAGMAGFALCLLSRNA